MHRNSVLIKLQPDIYLQIFIYCKVTLHVSGVTAPIIRSTKNCNAASGTGYNTGIATSRSGHVLGKYLYQYYDLYRRQRLQFLLLLMMGTVTPETCRVNYFLFILVFT